MAPSMKEQAIHMRSKGKTYAEILAKVPVAKSTLSLWLREVGMSEPQKQRITKKRLAAARRGALSRRNTRLEEERTFAQEGIREVGKLSKRELWLIGTALYWAEGSKQKEHAVSERLMFANSDVRMIRIFLLWLDAVGVAKSDILFELYIHTDRKEDTATIQKWWAKELGVTLHELGRVYFKTGNPKTIRKNVGDLYHGLIRIKVRSSTHLNRKVGGWVEGLVRGAK